jgi:hypothetical protein
LFVEDFIRRLPKALILGNRAFFKPPTINKPEQRVRKFSIQRILTANIPRNIVFLNKNNKHPSTFRTRVPISATLYQGLSAVVSLTTQHTIDELVLHHYETVSLYGKYTEDV